MRVAFAIVSMFPWGGLQRDCVRLALKAKDLGHEVTIFTSRTRGNIPDDIGIEILPARSLTNHGRNRKFGKALAQATLGRFDRVIGFDKIEGLDILYCGDLSFADRTAGLWTRLNPRVSAMIKLEGACFSVDSRTRILALAQPQIEGYRRAWGTPAERIRLLPPPIEPARRHPEYRTDGTRERMRSQLGLAPEALVALCVGSPTPNKGFDRAIAALADVPRWRLVICGVAGASPEGARFLAQARRHGVADRVHLLAPREDVPQVMAAADLFVHVARMETAGNVILEGVANGLPVIVSEVCGYSPHIKKANAGIVLGEPFRHADLTDALAIAADPARRARWSANAAAYGSDPVLYSGIDHALKAILANA